jgi:hypothetical protein
MGRVCRTNVEKMNAYRVLVERPEGKRPLQGQRRRWVDVGDFHGRLPHHLREIG